MVVGGWDGLLDRPRRHSIGGGGGKKGRQAGREKNGQGTGQWKRLASICWARERGTSKQHMAARLLPRWSVD